MENTPFFCDDCGMELGHDDIQVVSNVPQIDVESFEMFEGIAEVYQCSGCGMVVGFDSV